MTPREERQISEYLEEIKKAISRVGIGSANAFDLGYDHAIFVPSPHGSITRGTLQIVQNKLWVLGISSRPCHHGLTMTNSATWDLLIWKTEL